MVLKQLSVIMSILLIGACSSSPETNGVSNSTDIPIGHSEGCWLSDYTPAKNSEYVLPYPIGNQYLISQGNCGNSTHLKAPNLVMGLDVGDIRYAYDFAIPVGDKIVASRKGVVINLDDFYSDDANDVLKQNFIVIEHKDGSIAYYGHLKYSGALIEIGDEVDQGEVIGIAGKSGYTWNDPHLHFQVFDKNSKNCDMQRFNQSDKSTIRLSECTTIPITFKNADPLDSPLIEGKIYKALEY